MYLLLSCGKIQYLIGLVRSTKVFGSGVHRFSGGQQHKSQGFAELRFIFAKESHQRRSIRSDYKGSFFLQV